MSTINLGRVQGGGVFGSTSTSYTSILKSSVQSGNIDPLVGDTIINANGDMCRITAIAASSYSVTKYGSVRGPQGEKGETGDISTAGVVTLNTVQSITALKVFDQTPIKLMYAGDGTYLQPLQKYNYEGDVYVTIPHKNGTLAMVGDMECGTVRKSVTSTADAWVYTGCSVSVPAGKTVIVSGSCEWTASNSKEIAICTNSDTGQVIYTMVCGASVFGSVSCCTRIYRNTGNNAVTLYLMGKWVSAGTQNAWLDYIRID
jgi:hypothetical protein